MPTFQMFPSVTQWDYADSNDLENCIVSPRGEGKTDAGIMAMTCHSENQDKRYRPIPWAVIRDTWTNIERCLRLDTLVLTPSGWVKAEDIRVGDNLIAGDGTITDAVGVYNRSPELLWKVIFSDKTSVCVTDDHLWAVQGRWDRDQAGHRNRRCPREGTLPVPNGRLVTTAWIRKRLQQNKRTRLSWSIPIADPIQFPSQSVPIDAYLLGILLGDGGLSQSSIRFTTEDMEIIDSIRRVLPAGIKISRIPKSKYDYGISGLRGKPNPINDGLRKLGLKGLTSSDKFIPECYLLNDQETRLNLLRGLMDTDGCATIQKHSCFSSTSKRLIDGVEFLVRSLGGLTRRLPPSRMTSHIYKGKVITHRNPGLRLTIQMPKGVVPFQLSRKADRVSNRIKKPRRFIIKIEPDRIAPSVCFKVSHPSGLFIVQDFIVTHNTTLPSFLTPHPDSFPAKIRPFLHVQDGGKIITFPGFWKAYLFGVDSLSDLNRFQSMQLGGIWLEEPAPAAEEDIGAGISEDVWALGITSLRHPLMTKTAYEYLNSVIIPKFPNISPEESKRGLELGVFYTDIKGNLRIRNRRAQISMNYPDEDHWTWQRFYESGIGRLFRIPKGENRHVDDSYRRNMYEALKNRPDLLARLVEGKPSQVQIGVKVTPKYDPDIHRSNVILYPVKDVPVIRCWDGWLNPSCVFTQITPSGQFRVLYTLKGTNIGMKQFIERHVKPYISAGVDVGQKKQMDAKFKDVKIWRDMGDPTIASPDQSDSGFSAAQMINLELESRPGEKARFELGEPSWRAGKEAMEFVLMNMGMFLLSKDDVFMHKALSGKWCYKRNQDNTVVLDKPLDNDWSHPCRALTHVLAKLFHYHEKSDGRERPKPHNVGKTYAVPSLYPKERMVSGW